jgi:branched-chain amino acid transport system substrate-binding protein
MRHTTVRLAAAALAALASTGAAAQEALRLTIPLPLGGAQARTAEILRRSYEIAAEEINAAGGVKGRKLALEFADSRDRPSVARAIARRIVDGKQQPILFGEYSSACSHAVAELADEKGFPYLVVSGAADAITQQGYRWVFRLNAPNALYQSGLVAFLTSVVKPRSAAILYDDSEFGISSADTFRAAAEKAGLPVEYEEPYAKPDRVPQENAAPPTIGVDAKMMRALQPEVIFMSGYARDAVTLVTLLRKSGLKPKVLAGGAAGFALPDFPREAKDAAERVVTTALWSPDVGYPGAKEFAAKYRARHGEVPSYHGAEAHAALFVVKDALERARSWNPDDVREALRATNLMTVFGPVKFETNEEYDQQNLLPTLVLQVIDGKFEVVWPERHATHRYVAMP